MNLTKHSGLIRGNKTKNAIQAEMKELKPLPTGGHLASLWPLPWERQAPPLDTDLWARIWKTTRIVCHNSHVSGEEKNRP